MTYFELKHAPEDHLSEDFIDYLREINTVVFELNKWLVIENCKYHREDGRRGWWTAFYKEPIEHHSDISAYQLGKLFDAMPLSWEVRIKKKTDRSVRLAHIHFIE